MRILLLTVALLMTSCITINEPRVIDPPPKTGYINPTFDPIVQRFIYEAKVRGNLVDLSHIAMQLGNTRENKRSKNVGFCTLDINGDMLIMMNTSTWNKLGDYQREESLFHEMGHCLIGRKHCRFESKEGPISIMYPHLLNEAYYRKNREDLVDELFNARPECTNDKYYGDDADTDEVDRSIRSQTHSDFKR